MARYEVLYVLAPNLEEEAYAAYTERFSNIIKDNGGQVEKVDTWGKRRLAYEIKKFREGYYTVIYFNAPAECVKELDRVLKITEPVLRHLIVRHEEKKSASAERKVAAENA
ncbi:MAG: small subunit ribosomal protein [Bacillota bacterium]|jgi:small subunit ribosomal protein S6|nr:small subunit ribosomal protein [Bacillota bacterium]MDK2882116.1 small subunit ribosomal protein [Bacillota bacterium]MDK2924635.1 small subunit ribosomal protein [Bacillota bacterium]